MASLFNDSTEGVALGRLLRGMDITQPDYAAMIADQHGIWARMGVRHNLYTFPNFFRTTSASYTTTNSVTLAADLHETSPFFTFHREWTDGLMAQRVGLILMSFGQRFDLQAELFATDTGASLGVLNTSVGSGYAWASDTLILNANLAHEANNINNPPRGCLLKCEIRSNLAEAEFGNAFLYEYWITSGDV